MPCDSYDVAEGIRVSISEYEPNTGGNYEAHRDYHDLQFAITSEEAIDVTVTRVESLSAWQFEKNTLSERGEESPVQTKRLYHIAESVIQTVSDLM